MKRIIFLAICLLQYINSVNAQFIEKHKFNYSNAYYDILIIKVDSAVLENLKIVVNTKNLSEEDYFESMQIDTSYFAITASIVDSVCYPLGLFINNYKINNEINLATGTGNFYLTPNGYFATDPNHFIISESKKYNKNVNYNTAIQSGPLLLLNGKINSNFDKNSKNTNIRCGVGIYNTNNVDYLIFVKSITPVTFYEFANLFLTKYDCKNALCLESGGSCSMHLPSIKSKFRTDVSICNYIYLKLN